MGETRKTVIEKIQLFQKSYDIDRLKKLTLDEISTIVTNTGFNEEDLPILRELLCEQKQDGCSRSKTRKNRLKKKRVLRKKNKTQRGGEGSEVEGTEYVFIQIAAVLLAVLLMAFGGDNGRHLNKYQRK